MADKFKNNRGKAVPSGRLSRLVGFGGMAAGIAGNMAVKGARDIASGNRPAAADLLLTPRNALTLTRQLSKMRGAAMKIGQMISMDSGDFLPPEFANILSSLRADGQHMPRAQLYKMLRQEWGADWRARFASFEDHPIAAASIGQVQRAKLSSGEILAIKVQYPGVKDSIDSDVNNVASLLRLSGLVPDHMDVKPVIEEGRQQLHQEADYTREARYLTHFRQALENDNRYDVPTYYPEFSTDKVLAMSYLQGMPIEGLIGAVQDLRNNIVLRLMDLLLRELFEFGVMQTDPNFANYQYNSVTDQIILLDFGASRDIDAPLAKSYRDIFSAMLSGNPQRCLDVAMRIGFIPVDIREDHKAVTLKLIDMAITPMSRDEDFDFGDKTLTARLKDLAMPLAGERSLWSVPPANMVFVQRKLGGMFMLATRLEAKVNVYRLMRDYIDA